MASSINQDIVDILNRLERQMLVHSCLYYQLDKNIWSDKEFDHHAYHLADLLKKYPEEAKQCEWATHFRDWDGTTGFHLPLTHPWVVEIANRVWNIHERREAMGK